MGWIVAVVCGLGGLAVVGLVLAFTLGGGKANDGDPTSSASRNEQDSSVAYADIPAGWKVISETDYGVNVLMPDSPEYPIISNAEDGKKSYLSKNNNGRTYYRLECKRLGDMTPQHRKAELSKWAADSLHGWPKVHGRWEISLGEAPGIAVQASEEGSKVKNRCFIVGDRMISQMVFVKSGDFDTESTRRFLDSLRVDGLEVTHTREWYSNSAQ